MLLINRHTNVLTLYQKSRDSSIEGHAQHGNENIDTGHGGSNENIIDGLQVPLMDHCKTINNAIQDNHDHDNSLDHSDDHDNSTPLKTSGSQWFYGTSSACRYIELMMWKKMMITVM